MKNPLPAPDQIGQTLLVRVRVHQGPNANGILWVEFVNAKGRVVRPKGMESQILVAVPPDAIVKDKA